MIPTTAFRTVRSYFSFFAVSAILSSTLLPPRIVSTFPPILKSFASLLLLFCQFIIYMYNLHGQHLSFTTLLTFAGSSYLACFSKWRTCLTPEISTTNYCAWDQISQPVHRQKVPFQYYPPQSLPLLHPLVYVQCSIPSNNTNIRRHFGKNELKE